MTPFTPLSLPHFDTQEFLQEYWQKRPALLRKVIPGFQNFAPVETIFSIAKSETADSRLVLEKDGDYPWQVLHGPFESDDLETLPRNHWSLLVQNLELHIAEAADFLSLFNFLPNWRIDDLMVSYATDKGSVGPHLDNYDVFLFQAEGTRSWSINYRDYDETNFIKDLDLKIIDKFVANECWELEPGDMLYLPPGIAHHGVAQEKSITLSVGFRAPGRNEILAGLLDSLIENSTDVRFFDPQRKLQKHPGEIETDDLDSIHRILNSAFSNRSLLLDCLGKSCTELPENFFADEPDSLLDRTGFITRFKNEQFLRKHAVKSVFYRLEDGPILFVNGDRLVFPAELQSFVEEFSASPEFSNPLGNQQSCPEKLVDFLLELYNAGHLKAPGR